MLLEGGGRLFSLVFLLVLLFVCPKTCFAAILSETRTPTMAQTVNGPYSNNLWDVNTLPFAVR